MIEKMKRVHRNLVRFKDSHRNRHVFFTNKSCSQWVCTSMYGSIRDAMVGWFAMVFCDGAVRSNVFVPKVLVYRVIEIVCFLLVAYATTL